MPADYNIIQGPHVSEGLLGQQAESYGQLGRGLGEVAQGIAKAQQQKKDYEKFVGDQVQSFKDLVKKAPQADQQQIMAMANEAVPYFASGLKKIPKKQWHGHETTSFINTLRDSLEDKINASKAYHQSYKDLTDSKEPFKNQQAIDEHYINELDKPIEKRTPLHPNNPKFWNTGEMAHSFVVDRAAKDKVSRDYTDQDKNFHYTKQDLINPAFFAFDDNGKINKVNLRSAAEEFATKYPVAVQELLDKNPELSEHNAKGEHRVLNERGLQYIQDQILGPEIQRSYSPQIGKIISHTQLTLPPQTPGGAKLQEENQLAEERVKNLKSTLTRLKNGDTSVLQGLNEIGKTKGFKVSYQGYKDDTGSPLQGSITPEKAKIVKFTYELPEKVKLSDGTETTKIGERTASYNIDDENQIIPFLMHLSDRQSEVYGTKPNQDLVHNKLDEEMNKSKFDVEKYLKSKGLPYK